jgi:2-haloacid dehalogenase
MPTRFEVATFDNYGTLTDWEGGAAQFLYGLALRNGDRDLVPGIELRHRWEEIQFDILGQEYRSYKQVLAESLAALCAERGWPFDDALAAEFVASMRSWQPFPDTYPALSMWVPFDDVITAEDCRVYKPSPEFFRQALERVGVPPERITHVAFGFKYDNAPAKRFGMTTAWINPRRTATRRSPGRPHLARPLGPGAAGHRRTRPRVISWGHASIVDSDAAVLHRLHQIVQRRGIPIY